MLDRIRYFQAVVQKNSFSEAAEVCHISQSAISQQIKALERELGITLLDRYNRRFELTPAGAYFYKKSLVLVADYDRLVQETMRMTRTNDAELHIGYPKNYGKLQIQNAVTAFSGKYPDVKLFITNGSHDDLYDQMRLGKIDIVLNDQRRAFSDVYVNFSLGFRRTFAEIARRNPMAELPEITVEDLKNTPCIVISSREQESAEATYYRDIIGIRSEILFAGNLEEAQMLLIQSNGFLLIDEGTMESGTATVRVPLIRSGVQLSTHYCAFWRADNSGYYVEEFAEFLKNEFRGADS